MENEVKALKGVDLKLYTDELTAIVGTSGSGKSTLMNIIGGLDGDYSGEIDYGSGKLNNCSRQELADYRKDQIGFIFQHFHLIPHLTVLENVMLSLSMTNIDKKEKIERSKALIKQVGLWDYIDHKGNQLSGGQKQRVAVARALVKKPTILLADEPTGALDSSTSAEIMALLKSIVSPECMVIVITHDNDVADKADRCITLKDGDIISDTGSTRENVVQIAPSPEKKPTIRKSSYKEAIHLSMQRINYNRWRYFLVSIGGIVGLAGLFLALLLSQGVNDYVKDAYEKIVDSRKVVIRKDGGYIDGDNYFALQQNDRIEFIQKEHKISAVLEKDGQQIKYTVKHLQKEENREGHAKPTLRYGNFPKDGEEGIVIDEGLARKLVGKEENIKSLIGKVLEAKYLSPDNVSNYPARWDHQKLTILGIAEKSFVGEDYSYVSYKTHEDIVKRSRFISKNGQIDSDTLALYVKDSKDIGALAKKLGEDFIVTTPADQVKSLVTTFNILRIGVLAVSCVILVIAAIMVGIILFISVLERRNEIGVLKALGGRRSEIRWIFFAEGGLVGVFASITAVVVVGIVYGLMTVLKVNPEMMNLFKPTLWSVLLTFAVGVATHLIATVIPAGKASKFDPVELLRD